MEKIKQSKADWEGQYQSGAWEMLYSEDEYCHYTMVAGLVQKERAPVSLLDVGSGEGVILRYLDLAQIAKYTAMDLTQTALDRIKPRRGQDRYICSSVEEFVPDEQWDVILFNEILYYTFNPVAALSKFEKALKPKGRFVVSMYKKPGLFAYNNQCIRRLRRHFEQASYAVLDAVEVKRLTAPTAWQIFVVRPPGV